MRAAAPWILLLIGAFLGVVGLLVFIGGFSGEITSGEGPGDGSSRLRDRSALEDHSFQVVDEISNLPVVAARLDLLESDFGVTVDREGRGQMRASSEELVVVNAAGYLPWIGPIADRIKLWPLGRIQRHIEIEDGPAELEATCDLRSDLTYKDAWWSLLIARLGPVLEQVRFQRSPLRRVEYRQAWEKLVRVLGEDRVAEGRTQIAATDQQLLGLAICERRGLPSAQMPWPLKMIGLEQTHFWLGNREASRTDAKIARGRYKLEIVDPGVRIISLEKRRSVEIKRRIRATRRDP